MSRRRRLTHMAPADSPVISQTSPIARGMESFALKLAATSCKPMLSTGGFGNASTLPVGLCRVDDNVGASAQRGRASILGTHPVYQVPTLREPTCAGPEDLSICMPARRVRLCPLASPPEGYVAEPFQLYILIVHAINRGSYTSYFLWGHAVPSKAYLRGPNSCAMEASRPASPTN